MEMIERRFGSQGRRWAANAGLIGLLGVAASCAGPSSSPGGDDQLVGVAVLALSAAPPDGTCVEVTAVGYRSVTRTFNAAGGGNTIFQMTGLPLGQVTFSAQAFGGTCPGGDVPPPGPANWVSDSPFTTTVAVGPPALVTLNLVRNGNAKVSVGFDDMAGGAGAGVDGGAGAGGGGPGPDAGAGGAAGAPGIASAPVGDLSVGTGFLRVPNVKGESTVKGFEDWFDLTGFGLLASAAKGGGLQWTTTVDLRYQRGVPQLYADAAAGTIIGPVDLWFRSTSAVTFVYLKVTLTNAMITSIVDTGAAGTTPTLAVTLTSTRLDLEFIPQKSDGTAGAPIQVFWDGNSGSNISPISLDFTIDAPRTLNNIASFRAPSATGPGTFTDAAVTMRLDGTILQDVIAAGQQAVVPTGSVSFFKTDQTGVVGLYGSYGFQNAVVHSVTLTGANTSIVGFGADAFSWSVGPEMTTFP